MRIAGAFENVSQFKYLGMTVTNQNMIQEDIKRRFNSGNICYHQSWTFCKKNVNFRIYRRMVSSGLLRRVALVRTDVSEEPGASFIRATKIGELGTTQAATSNRVRYEEIPNIQASNSVWEWNLASVIMGGTSIEGVSEQGAEENILDKEMNWLEAGENCIMITITCTLHQGLKNVAWMW
jgi:hypothetical protein